ncbi:helix-turn-helix transcriptional regulator [Haloimpatiens lingqiaonensis]|uniref:helix-turn-helix transcriptional regulator n=1 Tax=Haloimpatiens lingqiaonensis TaxID=1380675 RepID=UPI0010FD91C1|nr:PAS domain-containing protein [Haloimpatiens lingqiaonensis]
MSSRDKLKKYIPLVEFMGKVLGKNSEVVLHDINNLDNSIVAIANGHISGRTVGGPVTDLVLKILKDGSYKEKNYICNYKGVSRDNKTLKSSSYFIKDDNGKLIGMICINTDITNIIKVKDMLDAFAFIEEEDTEKESEESGEVSVFENLDKNVEDVISSIINSVMEEYSIPPERMSLEEKMQVVKKLNEKGVFLLKGGVSEVAKSLRASDTTIYRYINKLK